MGDCVAGGVRADAPQKVRWTPDRGTHGGPILVCSDFRGMESVTDVWEQACFPLPGNHRPGVPRNGVCRPTVD